MDYQNDFADIFAVQGLNKQGKSIADYSFYNGEEEFRFSDFVSGKMRETFASNARELYKAARN